MRTAGHDTVADRNRALRATGPAGTEAVPLLASKITAPRPPAGLVDRPRLTNRLDAGVQAPLTLLVAPAGWGKTALLAGWFGGRRANGVAAWLTLESGDHANRFWSYLHAAIATEVGRRFPDRSSLPEPGRTGTEVFLPRFAAALAALPEPVLVVLDDTHTITDAEVTRGLEFLLRHCRGQLRLVLAGRGEPALALHRFRLTGELTELRSADLALTVSESERLVREQGLDLRPAQIRDLHARSEGWPAGVRLAGLACLGDDTVAASREAAGIPGPEIGEYLDAEVVTGQPATVRQTLVRTALLDRVCGALSDALTGRDDGERQLAAAARETAGFVTATGADPIWYRCHRMLGDALYAELLRWHPQDLPELHRRAYTWHRANGRPVAALRHALATADTAAAVELADAHWPELLLCGHEDALRTPLPPDLPAEHPALALAVAVDQVETTGRLDRDTVRPAGREPTRFATELAGCLTEGAHRTAAGYAGELLAGTGPADPPGADRVHAVALALLGTARFGLGELAMAEEALTAAVTVADRAGYRCPGRYASAQLALLYARRGELTRAQRSAQDALAMPACPGRRCAGHAAAAHLALALVCVHRDDLPDATRQLDQALALAGPGTAAAVTGLVPLVKAALWHASGDFAAVADLTLPAGTAEDHYHQLAQLAVAETRMACGDLGGARELLTRLAVVPQPKSTPAPGSAPPSATRSRSAVASQAAIALARWHLLTGEPAAAVGALPDWSAAARQPLTRLERLDAGLIEAVAARALGNQRQARELLEQVLDLAGADGHRRVFDHGGSPVRELLVEHLDSGTRHRAFVNDLVDSAGRRHAERHRAVPALTEPLTERELTVLRYLQSTLSNGEIAAELFLSVNTVKTHVRNIYQKLGAPRRRDAVRRARELRLL
ncbi:LuxR C-terminal-related transcriptional regulator [Solwaraspora sp. WMMB335]|uniref:LuxR C-terminal-related transcriptional regulator n=1 Tax=Solwaraspora sp. WMMB335 TaxID=3404118 RepID=UPI003B950464